MIIGYSYGIRLAYGIKKSEFHRTYVPAWSDLTFSFRTGVRYPHQTSAHSLERRVLIAHGLEQNAWVPVVGRRFSAHAVKLVMFTIDEQHAQRACHWAG